MAKIVEFPDIHMKIPDSYGLFYILMILTLCPLQLHSENTSQHPYCPSNCSCNQDYTVIDCSKGKYKSIPLLPASAEVVLLDSNHLPTLPSWAFQNASNIKQLSMQGCGIEDINSEAFCGLRQLEAVKLNGNYIKEIPRNIFSVESSISALLLADNRLTLASLAPGVDGLSSIKTLDISHNHINGDLELPWEFSSLVGLKSLRMDYAKLNLSGSFFNSLFNVSLLHLSLVSSHIYNVSVTVMNPLVSLTELDLTNSKITPSDAADLFQGLANATELQTLLMDNVFGWKQANAKLHKHFFKPFRDIQLKRLSFRGNTEAFGGILQHRVFKELHSLVILNLASCNIHTITDDGLHGLHKLKYLGLSRNFLTCYDEQACGFLKNSGSNNLDNLEELDLSRNNIDVYTEELVFRGSVFKNLHKLNLSYNKLSRLTHGMFHSLPNLHEMDLSGNPIDYITKDTFFDLPNLQSLFLNDSSELATIDERMFNGVHNLQYLYMQSCNLNKIDKKALMGLKILSVLNLRDNFLGYDNDSLNEVTIESSLLYKLDLGNNYLSHLPALVKSLSNITTLFLDHNFLTDDAWTDLQNNSALEVLDLSYNTLTKFTKKFLLSHKNLSKIDFSHNPFYCDCNFETINPLLNISNISIIEKSDYVCYGPDSAKGISIFYFKPSNWHCNVKPAIVPFICVILVLVTITVIYLVKRSGCDLPRIEINDSCCCNLQNCYLPLKQNTETDICTEELNSSPL